MESLTIGKKLLRFQNCNSKFYPYIEKVLKRLPEEVCFSSVLDDLNFEIISFGTPDIAGRFINFSNKIENLVILNESILHLAEFQIIHTVAHEIAHKIAGGGETGLYEKEAEELLVKWGFEKEVEAADYYIPIVESEGYQIGFKWAAKQEDLSDFEEFYQEWDEEILSDKRLEELIYTSDIISICDQLGLVGESFDILEGEPVDIPKIEEGTKLYPGDIFFDKGIIWGIMSFLKAKRSKIG